MRIGARLDRLERAAGPRVSACPECGYSPGQPEVVKYVAYFPSAKPEPDGPESCRRCGRVLRREYRATFK